MDAAEIRCRYRAGAFNRAYRVGRRFYGAEARRRRLVDPYNVQIRDVVGAKISENLIRLKV